LAKPKAIAIIPARLGSTRFPGKALASETGKPMVVHVCERAKLADSVADVVVATDSMEIVKAVQAHGFDAVMTSAEHENGTSRLIEASDTLGLKMETPIINVQGDEPEIEPAVIDAVLTPFHKVAMACYTVASPITDRAQLDDPNIVKVVTTIPRGTANDRQALYFSRAPIPFDRDHSNAAQPLRHVGIYGYTRAALIDLADLAPTPLEQHEKLEQLRWLEHHVPISVTIRPSNHTGIDTPEQYAAFVERHKASAGNA